MTPCLRSALNIALPSPTLTRTKFATLGTNGRPQRSEFVLQISAAFVRHPLRFRLVRFVRQRRQRAGLRDSVGIERRARFLQDPDQFRPRDAVAEPHAGERVDFGKSSQDDDVAVFPNESKRVGRIVQIFEIGLVEDDHDIVGHARHETVDGFLSNERPGWIIGIGDKDDAGLRGDRLRGSRRGRSDIRGPATSMALAPKSDATNR